MSTKILFLCAMWWVAISIFAFPIDQYDFNLPHTTPSTVAAALGGLNLGYADDYFLPITNPTTLRRVKNTTIAFSFARPPRDYEAFSDLFKAEPLLGSSTLRAVSYQAKNFGLAYRTLASSEKTVIGTLLFTKNYTAYDLSSYTVAFADSVGRFDWGVSGKLLHGHLVYLAESTPDQSTPTVDTFYDEDALGYSFDLGVGTTIGSMTYALTVYDIYSAIHWPEQSPAHIRTRLATGVDYTSGSSSVGAGMNSRWWFVGLPFYNVYYSYQIIGEKSSQLHQNKVRIGLVSQDFQQQDNVLYCFGVSYGYKAFSVDMGLQSRGIKANETQVYFSLTMGE